MHHNFLLLIFTLIFVAISIGVNAKDGAKAESPPPQTIVALSPHSVELLFSLGAGDRIVATTEYADFPKAAVDIPRVGGYHGLSIERILELQPDLVIAWKGGNSDADIKRLKNLGLKVYSSNPSSLEQVADELISLGNLVGLPESGQKLAAQYRERLTLLRQQHADKKPVRFFYQVWAQPLRAMAAGSWINEVVTGCGGVNILDSSYPDYPEVSLESVLLMAPDAILQPTQHGADMSTGVDWRDWPEIPAVKNKHIFSINGDILHRFTLRILDGMEEVCDRLERVRKNSVDATETKE